MTWLEALALLLFLFCLDADFALGVVVTLPLWVEEKKEGE